MRYWTALLRYIPLVFGVLGLLAFLGAAIAFGQLWPPRLVPLAGLTISIVLIAANLPGVVRSDRRRIVYPVLLGVYSLGVLYMGLRPKSWNRLRRPRLRNAFETGISGYDVVMNVIGFIPLGFLLTVVLMGVKRGWSALRAFTVATVTCGVVSLGIETAQIVIGGRSSSVIDVLTNVAGAAIGAGYAVVFVRLWDAVGGKKGDRLRRSLWLRKSMDLVR